MSLYLSNGYSGCLIYASKDEPLVGFFPKRLPGLKSVSGLGDNNDITLVLDTSVSQSKGQQWCEHGDGLRCKLDKRGNAAFGSMYFSKTPVEVSELSERRAVFVLPKSSLRLPNMRTITKYQSLTPADPTVVPNVPISGLSELVGFDLERAREAKTYLNSLHNSNQVLLEFDEHAMNGPILITIKV